MMEFEDLSREIIGAGIEVHKTLGPGFLESVYEEAFKLELARREIPSEAQKQILVEYLGNVVGTHRLDLLVDSQVVVELKAVKELNDAHFAQLRSYLKATGLNLGLLMNFSKSTLEVKRVVL